MSLFHSGWKEVYFGMDQQEYFKNQNILRENGIEFKTKIENNMPFMSNLDSRNGVLSRGSLTVNDHYKILVKAENVDRTNYLFNK